MARRHVVYQIEFENGKSYIGYTCDLKKRMNAHWGRRHELQTPLACALRSGASYEVRVLKECASIDEALREETAHIVLLDTVAPRGYNLTLGGEFQGAQASAIFWNAYRNEWTDEQRAAYGKKLSDAGKAADHGAVFRDRWKSNREEQKANQRIASRLGREKQKLLRQTDPTWVAKVTAKASASSRERWTDEDYRTRVVQGVNAAWADPELRKRQSEAGVRNATRQNANYSPEERLTVNANIARSLAKMSDYDVWRCRYGDLRNCAGTYLSKLFGIAAGNISTMRHGKTYKHVTREMFS